MRGVRWALRAGVVGAALFGCTLPSLDVTGKACPCPSDYGCDPATNTCVKGSATSSTSSTSSASSSSTGSGGASACTGTCGTEGCGTCPTTEPIAVDDAAYDIDPTEVTRASYQAFLDTKPDLSSQPPYCGWNSSFEPSVDVPDMGCDKPPDVETFPNRPITCIDWCDARAYCAWAKRRLCGRIGGGVLQESQAGDPQMSEWHHACTHDGTHAYPYGDAFIPDACNTMGAGFGGVPYDVGTLTTCVGGYTGLYDMSGNIEEWEDACGVGNLPDDPSDDGCPLRGGAFWTGDLQSRCDSLEFAAPRSAVSNDWGFRCCGPSG